MTKLKIFEFALKAVSALIDAIMSAIKLIGYIGKMMEPEAA